MSATTAAPPEAYLPDANRTAREARDQSPERLARYLTLLILFLTQPWNAVRLLRSGRLASFLYPAWWHDRTDLPAGSAQQAAASVRGPFGRSIRWMCLRHGIGPGHKDWPELSRAIVAYGGSLKGFRAGRPALGLQWWDNPNIVPGTVTEFRKPIAPTALLLAQDAVAHAVPAVPGVMQGEAAHARLPASWLSTARPHVLARAGPLPSTGPPDCPGLLTSLMSDARGRSMASPAVLIRAA
jgi:hypothetical protein